MSPIEKIKDSFFAHFGTTAALVVTSLVGWLLFHVAPIILPAIEQNLSSRVLLAMLLLSLFVNVFLAIVAWRLSQKRDPLKLKYGIFWDKNKNPHCPVCKNPGLHYAQWYTNSYGYRCNPCNKVFRLSDASGNHIEPKQAISEL